MPKTSLEYVLRALIPYSESNLKLVFKPHAFFRDLEKISRNKEATLRSAYYRAQKSGLIEIDSTYVPRLTDKGHRRARKFTAKHLGKNARLMVIFDIPEAEKSKRQRLRRLLHKLGFKQVQKSVWLSEFDHREYLSIEIMEQGMADYLQIYEAVQLQS